jgi:hypothetical protein
MYARRRWHLDDLSRNQFVFDPITVLVVLVRQSKVLLGRQDCRGGHNAILPPQRCYTPQQ